MNSWKYFTLKLNIYQIIFKLRYVATYVLGLGNNTIASTVMIVIYRDNDLIIE